MNTERKLVVMGAGGFAAEVIETALLCGWNVLGCYDGDASGAGRMVMGVTCLGSIESYITDPQSWPTYVFAIGNNPARQRIARQLMEAGREPVSLVHPTAVVSRTAKVGAGAFVGALAFVGPQVRIGAHVIVNVGTSVGHDVSVGDFAQLCPGARVSGFCAVGEGAFLGSNAVLAPRISMGDWSKLSAGSFAARDVPAGKLAIGVPAKIVAD